MQVQDQAPRQGALAAADADAAAAAVEAVPEHAGAEVDPAKLYIGLKVVAASQSTRESAELLLGRQLGDDTTSGTDEGYLVEYADGYKAWSPKAAFDDAYLPTSAMDFSSALFAALKSFRITHPDAGGKQYWVAVGASGIPEDAIGDPHMRLFASSAGGKATVEPYWVCYDPSTGAHHIGWVPTTAEMFRKDWRVV